MNAPQNTIYWRMVQRLRSLHARLEKRVARRMRIYGAVCRMNRRLGEGGLDIVWWHRNAGRLLELDSRWFPRVTDTHVLGHDTQPSIGGRDVCGCPDCGGIEFDRGASGGSSVNVCCRTCGQWWNDMGPLGMERVCGPSTAARDSAKGIRGRSRGGGGGRRIKR
jgi:hypothetical protein